MMITFAIVLLAAGSASNGTPARTACANALEEATRVFGRWNGSDAENASATIHAAEKRAFDICSRAEVPAALRNEAIVRWSNGLDRASEMNLLMSAVEKTEAEEGPTSAALIPLLDRIGTRYEEASRRDEALRLFERALAIRRKSFGEISAEASKGLQLVASHWAVEVHGRDPQLAEHYYRQAAAVAMKACGRSCDEYGAALVGLLDLLKTLPGREADAHAVEEELMAPPD